MRETPPTPSWMEIVALGEESVTYRNGGIRVMTITYMGWYVIQVKWSKYATAEAITRAVSDFVPAGARLRGGSSPAAHTNAGWIFDQLYVRTYLQWEPIRINEQEIPLAQVS